MSKHKSILSTVLGNIPYLKYILFLHALSWCYTTSTQFKKGKNFQQITKRQPISTDVFQQENCLSQQLSENGSY